MDRAAHEEHRGRGRRVDDPHQTPPITLLTDARRFRLPAFLTASVRIVQSPADVVASMHGKRPMQQPGVCGRNGRYAGRGGIGEPLRASRFPPCTMSTPVSIGRIESRILEDAEQPLGGKQDREAAARSANRLTSGKRRWSG